MNRAALLLLIAATLFAADPLRQAAGKYAVTLRLPEGGLIAAEENEIEFRVEDTSRPDPVTGFSPVIRATPSAIIDMPAMPGMPKFSATAHPEGVPGDYGIHPTFAHGGAYRLRIEVHPPAGEAFTVEFPLEVTDASQAAGRKPLPPRYRLEIAAKSPKVGQPVEIRLLLRDRENGVVRDFESMHEAYMHLVIVRRDLKHFAHVHPELAADGTFRIPYTFAAGGDYRLFADAAPRGAGGQIVSASLKVDGNRDVRMPLPTYPTKVGMTPHDGIVPVRKSVTIGFALRDGSTGRNVTDIEPYLGVQGHLMLVHEDAATFVHSHPVDDRSMDFLARFPKPGVYRGWLQFQRAGQVETAEFVFRAEAGR